MPAELPSIEQILTETSRLVPLNYRHMNAYTRQRLFDFTYGEVVLTLFVDNSGEHRKS